MLGSGDRYNRPTAIKEKTMPIKHGSTTCLPQALPRGYARSKATPAIGTERDNLKFESAPMRAKKVGSTGIIDAMRRKTGHAKNIQNGAIQRERRKTQHAIVLIISRAVIHGHKSNVRVNKLSSSLPAKKLFISFISYSI